MSASDTPPHEQFVSDEVPKPGLWEAARNLVIKRSEATSPRNPGTEDHRPGAGKTGGDEVFQSADPRNAQTSRAYSRRRNKSASKAWTGCGSFWRSVSLP